MRRSLIPTLVALVFCFAASCTSNDVAGKWQQILTIAERGDADAQTLVPGLAAVRAAESTGP